MERIISYDELPYGNKESIYFRVETDPELYIRLLSRGYKVINNIIYADENTIYVTGKRQDYSCQNNEEYVKKVHYKIEDSLSTKGIEKPVTYNFSINDLLTYQYKLPFVLKNENQNGGREKFLIATEQDYENLIKACIFLLNKDTNSNSKDKQDVKNLLNYGNYLTQNFTVQEYINTPTEYNTTVRLLTSPSNDLLYAALKYNKQEEYRDNTTLLGYLLSEVYPLSTKSIVSNTLSGGENILLGERFYPESDKELLRSHNINSNQTKIFQRL